VCGKKGEERTSSIANGVCMDNYICKSWITWISKNVSQKKNGQLYGNCTCNALPVLEDNMHVNASIVQLELPAG